MPSADTSDTATLARHGEIWAVRPELRRVYQEWFGWLLDAVAGLAPVVEVGSGPGFFKDFAPRLVATDITPGARADVRCDACALPFGTASVGALVMVDALHHLPHPLIFMAEAARVLRPGGRLAMVEPWVTPASFLLYRYFHHEDCRLGIDVARPFGDPGKRALDGNSAIPRLVLRRWQRDGGPLRLIRSRTTFLTTHRPSPLRLCDAVWSVEGGSVVKLDAAKLMTRNDGNWPTASQSAHQPG